MSKQQPLLSVVTPAYREARNLPIIYERLRSVLEGAEVTWEWLIVDDHSPDDTMKVARELSERDDRVRAVRLSRNSGSHIAASCGIAHAMGDAVVVMACDLQDPPEVLVELLGAWRTGAQVVWAVRSEGSAKGGAAVFSRLYHSLLSRLSGLESMPSTGVDFFLIDRRVADAVAGFPERNVSLFALIHWMGFRQVSIAYTKGNRLHGASGWTLSKKLKLVVDSVTSFSYFPIRAMSVTGFAVAMAGFFYAIWVLITALTGDPVQGWASLIIVVLLLSGLQMIMLGVLGEYMWRAFDEARRRPRYLIEDVAGGVNLAARRAAVATPE